MSSKAIKWLSSWGRSYLGACIIIIFIKTALRDAVRDGMLHPPTWVLACIALPRLAPRRRFLVLFEMCTVSEAAWEGEEDGSNCSPDRSSSPWLSQGSTLQLACRYSAAVNQAGCFRDLWLWHLRASLWGNITDTWNAYQTTTLSLLILGFL